MRQSALFSIYIYSFIFIVPSELKVTTVKHERLEEKEHEVLN